MCRGEDETLGSKLWSGKLDFLALTSGEGIEISGLMFRLVDDSRDHVYVGGRLMGPSLCSEVERFKAQCRGGAGWIPGLI